MTERETLLWLAGLFEGEASFLRPSPSRPGEPKVDLEMTDEDVVRRVAVMMGVKYRTRDRNRPNVSVTFHVRLCGKRAVQLMWRIKPFMSARRQVQILRAVQCYIDRGEAWHPDNLPTYQFNPVCSVGMCANLRDGASDKCPAHGDDVVVGHIGPAGDSVAAAA